MTEDLRRADQVMVNFLQVRSTDTACADTDENFAFVNLWYRHILRADSTRAAIDTGAHLFRYRRTERKCVGIKMRGRHRKLLAQICLEPLAAGNAHFLRSIRLLQRE